MDVVSAAEEFSEEWGFVFEELVEGGDEEVFAFSVEPEAVFVCFE